MIAAPDRAHDLFEDTPYRALRALASGGMGEIILVEHRQLERPFVAKVLHAGLCGEPRLVDRMRVEAQALGRLSHPHIVSIQGVGSTKEGRPFLVMEYLKGRTLGEELARRGGALPLLEALAYACQLLSALSAAHELGIVHRDIKPDNLFLCDRSLGPYSLLKVLDFGVARILPGAPSAPAPLQVPTETGVVVGTPKYVSPEAVLGKTLDARADLYGTALVLYRMIAGRGPFDHIADERELCRAHVQDQPLPPSHLARAPLPAELDRLILRGLAKQPRDRFPGADEFRCSLEEVGRALAGPVGWAETVGFDASDLWEPPEAGTADAPTVSGSIRALPRSELGSEAPTRTLPLDVAETTEELPAPLPIAEPAPLPSPLAAEERANPSSAAKPTSKGALALLFLLTTGGVLLLALAAVGLLRWLR